MSDAVGGAKQRPNVLDFLKEVLVVVEVCGNSWIATLVLPELVTDFTHFLKHITGSASAVACFSTHFFYAFSTFYPLFPPILDACSLILNLVGPSTLSLLRDLCFDLSGVAILAVPADLEKSERGSFNKVVLETDQVPVFIYDSKCSC